MIIRVLKARQDSKEVLEHQEKRETKVLLDHQGYKVLLVLKVLQGLQELQDYEDHQVLL